MNSKSFLLINILTSCQYIDTYIVKYAKIVVKVSLGVSIVKFERNAMKITRATKGALNVITENKIPQG